MTHEQIEKVCKPHEFHSMTPSQRRRAVRAQIRHTPDAHRQETWIEIAIDEDEYYRQITYVPEGERNICGTAFCFAGWAVVLAGDRFIRDDEIQRLDGGIEKVNNRASNLLGVQAEPGTSYHVLFSPTNSLDDIDRILASLDDAKATQPEGTI